MSVDPLDEKYRSFGWEVIRIDGHNMREIVEGFGRAKEITDKPVALLAETVKGKGVSFMPVRRQASIQPSAGHSKMCI